MPNGTRSASDETDRTRGRKQWAIRVHRAASDTCSFAFAMWGRADHSVTRIKRTDIDRCSVFVGATLNIRSVVFVAAGLAFLATTPALAQSCATVTSKTLGALSARKTNTSMTYIEFEGACVRGAVDCSMTPVPSISVITTCFPVPNHVQGGIVHAFSELTGQGGKEVSGFVVKCIGARSAREHPTDVEVGKVLLICTEFDKKSVELRADPRSP